MERKGEKKRRLGNGITIERYAPTPLESILAIGNREKARKAIEESERKETSYVRQLEIRKEMEEIVAKMKADYSKLSN